MARQSIFTVGGTVQAGSGLYISRRADDELLNSCRAGTFAYVLTSRQMGKSSLMVRTAERLTAEGVTPVIIDLNQLGVQVTAEEWYLGLLTTIEDSLMLDTDVVTWWKKHQQLGMIQRLTFFFEKVLLAEVSTRVVIFVDEIDSTLDMDFRSDFFAAIRFIYNARATTPTFQRLSFVLIGVATPSDLIDDPKRTPFNIGQRIDLTDFTLEEARPFVNGLGLSSQYKAHRLLSWILKWTGGHPYLTQRLGQIVAEQGRREWTEAEVDSLVADTFFGEQSEKDHNLQFVRDMLTRRAPDLASVMGLYREIRLNLYPVPNDETSLSMTHLKLAGVVRRDNGFVRIRNPIYSTVFDIEWIEEVETSQQIADPREVARLRALAEAQEKQVEAERQRAEEEQRRAEAERRQAREQQRRAEAEEQRAEMERQQAIEQARLAAQLRRRAIWLGVALTVAVIAVIIAILLGLQAQSNALTAEVGATQEAIARATAQADSLRAINAEAIAQAERATAQADAIRALDAEATAQAERAIADGKSLEAANAEATARAEAVLAFVAQETAQAEATRSFEAEATAQAEATRSINAEATAQAGATLEAVARATAQAQAVRADQARDDAEREADRAKEAENDAENERATAERRGTLEAEARQTADAARSAAEVESTRAFQEQQRAEEEARKAREAEERAEEQARLATSRDLTTQANSLRDTQLGLALLLNLEAIRIADTVETRSNLLDTLLSLSFRLSTLTGHVSRVESVAFDRDHQLLASGSRDNTFRLWDISDRLNPRLFSSNFGHENGVFSVALNPAEQMVATGGGDTMIKLWNVMVPTNPQQLDPVLSDHAGEVVTLAFSPDGQSLASGSTDSDIIIWNTAAMTMTQVLTGHSDIVWSVAFNPTRGDILASGSNDRTIRLWDVRTGKELKRLGVDDHQADEVISVAFSPDGRFLASGHVNGATFVWDVTDPADPQELARTSRFPSAVWSVAFGDNRTLASGRADGTISPWRLTQEDPPSLERIGPPLSGHTNEVRNITFLGDGTTLASGSWDNTIILWDFRTQSRGLQVSPPLAGHSREVRSVAFSPDGITLASGSNDTNVILWDLSERTNPRRIITLTGHGSEVRSVAFSPDGQTLASGSLDQTVILWDVANLDNPRLGLPLVGHKAGIDSVAFSPDGRILASGSLDDTINLWDVADPANPRLLDRLAEHNGAVRSVAFSAPNDQIILASGGNDQTIILWDISDRDNPRPLGEPLSGHNSAVLELAFSPDGDTLASGGFDNMLILWDVSEPGEAQRFEPSLTGHTFPVYGLAFNPVPTPDEQLLVSGSFFGGPTVKLWNVADKTGAQELGAASIDNMNSVRSLAFSPNGETLALGGTVFTDPNDGTVALWDITLEAIEERACNIAGRNLTQAELDQFIPTDFQRTSDEPIVCPNFPYPAPALAPLPTPLPTATPTATPILIPSPTFSLATLTPTPTPGATATPAASPSTTATTAAPTPTPSLTTTPGSATPPTPTLTPESTFTATVTSTPETALTETSTPSPAATFTATLTPTPESTPTSATSTPSPTPSPASTPLQKPIPVLAVPPSLAP